MMWHLKHAGPPHRDMPPTEALAWALAALFGYWLWMMAYPWFGEPIAKVLLQ